jgi:ABC-type Fe3+-hydroxamate transport system substrate-binding protein
MISENVIIDSIGNKFSKGNYTRIISLVPSLTDLLFSFGLEESIIGVTKYCIFPPQAQSQPRTIVGGTKNPNINLIKSLNPDLILLNKEENQLKHFNQLIDYPVFVTYPKTTSEALKLFHDLKELFQIERVPELDKLNDLIQNIQFKVKLLPKKKVFCPIWKNPWISFNHDTFASSMIDLCGGENILNYEIDRYPKISLEKILKLEPEIILLPDEPYKFELSDKLELLELGISKPFSVHLIPGTFHWYSFKMIESIVNLEKVLLN